MENKDFENIIKNILKESHKQGSLNEDFEDDDEDEDLGIYSSDFNRDEFQGDAMKAAMQDIGSEFTPLGKSKFEKNLDPEEFMSDLERQNLNLRNDKEERKKLQKAIDTKKKHEKMFGAGSMNEESEEELPHADNPDGFSFDMKNLYSYLKDAFWTLKYYDYAVAAEILEKALKRDYGFTGAKLNEVSPYIENPKVNVNSKVQRPKDAEGQPITYQARVEDLKTGAVGKVARFGTNSKGELVVDVHWITEPAPAGKSLPTDIVVRDTQRVVREDEIEEGIGHSHTIGRGQNLKPSNYPDTLKRMNENLDNAQPEQKGDKVFLVVDDAFNRSHYKHLIGKTFDNPPGYARVKQINIEDADTESKIDYDLDEDFDCAAAERAYHDAKDYEEKQNLIGKQIVITNINAIQEMLFPNTKRIQSILDSIKEEIANHRVFNNVIAATDNMDTTWLFDLKNVTDDTIELQFTGTAK